MNALQDPFKLKKAEKKNDSLYKFVIILLLLVIIGGGVYLFVIKPRTQGTNTDQTAQNAEETEKYNQLITKIKKIILVPDENPTIATIANLEEVQKQNATFYADAKEGDTVIIFSTKALIYRESEDKIINVAPVTKEDNPTE